MQYRCKGQAPPQTRQQRYYLRSKGIRVCPEWDDYAVFREWALANGFRKGLVLYRENTDGDSEPFNCVWVTPAERVYNSRCTYWLTYNGETLPSPVWAKRFGLHPQQLRQRLADGWSVEDALTVPIGQLRAGHGPGRTPYPRELREAMAAHRKLERTIDRRLREEQDQ